MYEFTTVIYEPADGVTGWVTHSDIQDDAVGSRPAMRDADQGVRRRQVHLDRTDRKIWSTNDDDDPAPPAISSGVYFGLGSGLPAATTAVDKFVFNTYTFDFEPNGVFLHTS